MVLWYQEKKSFQDVTMEPAKSCITNRMVFQQLVTGWSGEDRISQLLSEALAAKDTEDLEFEVVDWLDLWPIIGSIPSGKRLQNYGKSPCLVGKSTINGNFHLVI